MTEPANLSEAFRDRTEALDALGRAVVSHREAGEKYYAVCRNHITSLWGTPEYAEASGAWKAYMSDKGAQQDAADAYYEAHKTVQKFLNGDASE